MTHDEIIRDAAKLLRAKAVPLEQLVDALDDDTRAALTARLAIPRGEPLCPKCRMRAAAPGPSDGTARAGKCCCYACHLLDRGPVAGGACHDCPLRSGAP